MPYEYYRDNVAKSLELFDQLVRLGRPRVVFSSSASVYAEVEGFEVFEDSPTDPTSPYARTKRMMEMVLQDLARADRPAGADPALLQPDRRGSRSAARDARPGALPRAGSAGAGRPGPARRVHNHRHRLSDPGRYRTARLHPRLGPRLGPRGARSSDSTPMLAAAAAPSAIVNLGTGRGVTVRELVDAVATVLGQPVPVREAPRRDGDADGRVRERRPGARELAGLDRRSSSLAEGVASAFAWTAKRQQILGYE